MTEPKIRILKRLDRAALETVAKSRLAAIALLVSEKVGVRALTSSVNGWILERNENRSDERAASRKQILSWKKK